MLVHPAGPLVPLQAAVARLYMYPPSAPFRDVGICGAYNWVPHCYENGWRDTSEAVNYWNSSPAIASAASACGSLQQKNRNCSEKSPLATKACLFCPGQGTVNHGLHVQVANEPKDSWTNSPQKLTWPFGRGANPCLPHCTVAQSNPKRFVNLNSR